jgi:putative photosynthetic complex assembly protein
MSAAARRRAGIPVATVGLILGAVVIAAGIARQTGFATNAPSAPPAESYLLSFSDLPDGRVAVYNSTDSQLITTIAPQAGGFIRSTIRSLDNVRARENIGEFAPFKLTMLDNRHLELTDTATGQMIDLEAFGPSNESAFNTLFIEAGKNP